MPHFSVSSGKMLSISVPQYLSEQQPDFRKRSYIPLPCFSFVNRKQILESVHFVLASESALRSEAAVDALAAACALDGLGSQAALDLLLKSRSTYISQQLVVAASLEVEMAPSNQLKGSLVQTTEQLSSLAVSIQKTVYQVLGTLLWKGLHISCLPNAHLFNCK
jgi:hypothetical protein